MRIFRLFGCVLLLSLLLIGCKSTPSEKDIKNDLSNYEDENFFDITKVTIDRELSEEKKDTIDCTVETSNEFADMIFYLSLNYTKYDTGGWQIDSIEERKDYDVTINAEPSSDSVTSEVDKIMQQNSISDYSIVSSSFDKNSGIGSVDVRAFIEDDTYIKYYKDMVFNSYFERGYWNISYENSGDDVQYAVLKNSIEGKTYSGTNNDEYDPEYAQITISKIDGSTVTCSYILKYIGRDVEWGTGKETLTVLSEDEGDAVVYTEFENPTLTGPHYYGTFDTDFYWTNPTLYISNNKIYLEIGTEWLELNEGELSDSIINIHSNASENNTTSNNTAVDSSDQSVPYGDFQKQLNNDYSGWCDLSIQEYQGETSVYISGYENGNHETAFFEGALFKESDLVYTSYCESTEADLRIEVSGENINVTISNSIYDDDSILSGIYYKK